MIFHDGPSIFPVSSNNIPLFNPSIVLKALNDSLFLPCLKKC